MPWWVNVPLSPALRAKVDRPGFIATAGADQAGCADASLYRRFSAAGLTNLTFLPQLVAVTPGIEPARLATFESQFEPLVPLRKRVARSEKQKLRRKASAGSHLTQRWRKQSRANSSLEGQIPCYSGKIQGISSNLVQVTRICRRNGRSNQGLTSKFPTR